MRCEVHDIGLEHSKVVIIDDAVADPIAAIALAQTEPFSDVITNIYPGIRRPLRANVAAEKNYIEELRRLAGPVMEEVFGLPGFGIGQAAFSLITRRPHETHPLVRVPHYDGINPGKYALLHFLSPSPQGGTGFYRHRATGIERVSEARQTAFDHAVLADLGAGALAAPTYMHGSTESFEQIAFFEGRFNRVLIYPGAALHSAHIPDDFAYSADPGNGRLTTNLFLLTRP